MLLTWYGLVRILRIYTGSNTIRRFLRNNNNRAYAWGWTSCKFYDIKIFKTLELILNVLNVYGKDTPMTLCDWLYISVTLMCSFTWTSLIFPILQLNSDGYWTAVKLGLHATGVSRDKEKAKLIMLKDLTVTHGMTRIWVLNNIYFCLIWLISVWNIAYKIA